MAKNEVQNGLEEGKEVEKAVVKKVIKKDSVEIGGKVFTEVVEDFRTGKDKVNTVIEVKHPFDEFEDNIRLTIKNNSRRGKYEYRARKELAEGNSPSYDIKGTVTLHSFDDKKRRQSGEFAGIEIEDRFDGGMLYAYIRDEVVRGAFIMLAKEHLNVTEKSGKAE